MIAAPACWVRGCIHYTGVIQPDGTEQSEKCACKAFPNGIPDEIVIGENKHLKKHPEQKNNIVFKSKKK